MKSLSSKKFVIPKQGIMAREICFCPAKADSLRLSPRLHPGFGKQGRLSPGKEHPFGMTKMKGYSN
jgi:hypothetical protein